MSENKSLKQSLIDFQTEMKGLLLEDTFQVRGKRWTMRLPNEEEQTWITSMLNMSTTMSTYMSTRLAALAMGIKKIDGNDIYDYFMEDWFKLEESERRALENMNKYSRKYFVAEHLHEMLAEMPSEVINDLWEKWQELEDRRRSAQETAKKSSGETSPTSSDMI
jgi:hypothetical protein